MIDGVSLGWLWAIGGLALLCAELIAPGIFLVFVGAAALATGAAVLLFDLTLTVSLVLFAAFALLGVQLGRRFYARPETGHDDPLLNDRAGRLIGRSLVVTRAIEGQDGRVRVGDGEWTARGGPAAVGATVRVTAVEGNCLIVEPIQE